jgi:hypothetical protein
MMKHLGRLLTMPILAVVWITPVGAQQPCADHPKTFLVDLRILPPEHSASPRRSSSLTASPPWRRSCIREGPLAGPF